MLGPLNGATAAPNPRLRGRRCGHGGERLRQRHPAPHMATPNFQPGVTEKRPVRRQTPGRTRTARFRKLLPWMVFVAHAESMTSPGSPESAEPPPESTKPQPESAKATGGCGVWLVGIFVAIPVLLLGSCVALLSGRGTDDSASSAPATTKYNQTWTKSHNTTTCDDWQQTMSAAQTWAASADLLTSGRNKVAGTQNS